MGREMKEIKNSQSRLWKRISETQITEDAADYLDDFKNSPVNFKIALWSPEVNGIRYYKSLLYTLAASLSPELIDKIRNVKNRNVGAPITVKFKNNEICMDYIQAVYELEFIESNLKLDGMDILEIGGGYGRTCHTIISNHDISSYSIIDLDNCLNLSRAYLKRVLSESQYSRIRFYSISEIDILKDSLFDLCVNIDSFAEMEPDVVNHYLDYINSQCAHFYVKNPIGKYLDKSLDSHSQGDEMVNIALSMGVLRDVIDIFDSNEIKAQRGKFLKAYNPDGAWECLADSWAKPWSYYWQALYKKVKE